MAIKIDLRVPPCKPVPEVTAFVQECEDAGFDGVGMLDSQMLERDVFVSMAHALLNTKTIKVASAVTNPVTRHPSVLASAAQTVSEIAPGRAQIWMGRGYSSANVVGIPPATVRQMRDATVMMKELMAGSEIDFGETSSRMKHGGGVTTPVYIAATGPRVMKVAGEVADGALMMVGLHPLTIAAARRKLEAGAKRSGRDLSDFKTIYITPMTVDEDGREARRWPQSWFRHDQPYLKYPSDSNLIWLREAGIDLPNDLIPEKISDSQAEDICDAFGLFGTAQECLTRLIRAGDESEVEQVFIFPTHTQDGGYDMPRAEVEAFQEVIFPGLCR